MIISALTEQYPGIENLPGALDKVREHTVDEFNFYVEDGHVWIGFDEYEIADGAARVFDVELPVTPGQAESAEPAEADGTGAAPEAFTVQQPSIQRVDWDQPTNCTEVYFERPVFDSTAQGYDIMCPADMLESSVKTVQEISRNRLAISVNRIRRGIFLSITPAHPQ